MNIFWNTSFVGKALKPLFEDKATVAFPIAIASGAHQVLDITDLNVKALVLLKSTDGNGLKLSFSDTETDPPPASSNNHVRVDMSTDNAQLVIPLEGVKKILIENIGGSSVIVQGFFLALPAS